MAFVTIRRSGIYLNFRILSDLWLIAKIQNLSASGCVVERRICNREVAGSNLGRGYFAPMATQPSILPWR